MPTVGMDSSRVTAAATAAGTHSSTTEKQPAASRAWYHQRGGAAGCNGWALALMLHQANVSDRGIRQLLQPPDRCSSV